MICILKKLTVKIDLILMRVPYFKLTLRFDLIIKHAPYSKLTVGAQLNFNADILL